jgi:pimeloyl-ACP methyl ester carboxylesterase
MLIHGWACTGEYWLPQLRRATGDIAAHALDLPGFGATATPPCVTFSEYADVVAATMSALRPAASWTVVGHSMGAGIAFELARRHPGLVDAVVLEGATPHTPLSAPRERRLAELTSGQPTQEWFSNIARTWFKQVSEDDFARAVEIAKSTPLATLVASLRMIMQGVGSAHLDSGVRAVLAYGSADVNRRLDQFPAAAASMPAELYEFSDSGHTPHVESPDAFAALIRHVTLGHDSVVSLAP